MWLLFQHSFGVFQTQQICTVDFGNFGFNVEIYLQIADFYRSYTSVILLTTCIIISILLGSLRIGCFFSRLTDRAMRLRRTTCLLQGPTRHDIWFHLIPFDSILLLQSFRKLCNNKITWCFYKNINYFLAMQTYKECYSHLKIYTN